VRLCANECVDEGERWRTHEVRLACDLRDFYICASRPRLDDKSACNGGRETPVDEKSGPKLTQVTDLELLNKSIEAAKRAYAPYSKFLVGAVLVAKDGQLFEGCNVENVSFGLTICAERNAVFAAVAAGYREFTKIVIATDLPEPASPCGACRQVLCEFNQDIEIVLGTFGGKMVSHRLSELLPHPCLGILDRR